MRSTDNQPHVNASYYQGVGWPLHDDSGIVTATALEEQLELVRASSVSTAAGVFGPASMTWRMNREAILFLAAGRALLLQLAHPWIAAAVADHSGAAVLFPKVVEGRRQLVTDVIADYSRDADPTRLGEAF